MRTLRNYPIGAWFMQGSALAASFSCYVPAQPETRTKMSSRNKIKSPAALSNTVLTAQFISDTVKKLQEERNDGSVCSSNVFRRGVWQTTVLQTHSYDGDVI